MSRPIFGDLGAKAALIAKSKHDAAVKKARVAMRQLGVGVVKRCDICKEMPYETCFNSWPCSHTSLYDSSLRGYDLAVLNDAARIWVAEKPESKTESEEIPW